MPNKYIIKHYSLAGDEVGGRGIKGSLNIQGEVGNSVLDIC